VALLQIAAVIALGAMLGGALTLAVLAAEVPAKARATWENVESLWGLEVICQQDPVEQLVCTWTRREQP
jgi:hypothetical protein